MRSRPVIPIIGRRVTVPWRLGEYVVPPETGVLVSILLVHHRDDVYPRPFEFRPSASSAESPGPTPGFRSAAGSARLGAALAMAEQRVVLDAVTRRADMHARSATRAGAQPQRDDDPGARCARGRLGSPAGLGRRPLSFTRAPSRGVDNPEIAIYR